MGVSLRRPARKLEPVDPPSRVVLPRYIYDDLKDHTVGEIPREACGIIGLLDEHAVLLRRCANVAPTPTSGYVIAPADHATAGLQFERRGLALLFYHSHPCGLPEPSEEDLRFAVPGSLHLIVGMARGFQVSAWRIGRTDAERIPVEVGE